jgi:class 3 adenylate cyclase
VTGPGAIRVSDHERQAVVDRLSWATGEGMLTLEEFAETSAEAYAAVTRADLAAVGRDLHLPVPLVAPLPPEAPTAAAATAPVAGASPAALDLPTEAAGQAAPPVPAAEPAPQAVPITRPASSWVVAVMSGEDRRGRWRVGRNLGAFALMGSVDLDLRDAVIEGDVVEINAWAIMGGVTITVPEGIPVETSGFVLMGGRTTRIKDVPPLPGAPTIRVVGYGLWGGVTVRSRGPRRDRSDREERVQQIVDDALETAQQHIDRHLGHSRERTPRPPRPPRLPQPPPVPGPGWPHDGSATPPGAPVPPGRRGARDTAPVLPPPGQRPSGGLVTIVSTDIVGSTRRASELGDQVWHSVLLAHNAIVRDELTRYGGTEVKTSGDGFLVTFTSTRAAVQFSLAVQEALREQGRRVPELALDVRIGVHAGEVEHDGRDVIGRNVTIACRLCDVAAPGEVLASGVVADLADSASDLSFGPPREHQLAGIDRPLIARPALRR